MNKAGIDGFIGMYGRDIYSFCCYLTRSRQEADDLYQDSFVQILEKGLPDEEEAAKNMILSAAVRIWKDKKRKFAWRRRIEEEKYIPVALDDALDRTKDLPEEEIIKSERNAYIRNCVDALPEKMRLVVILYYMENRKVNEIAEVLHIPQGTVKSRLHRAKTILSEKLKDYQDKEEHVL